MTFNSLNQEPVLVIGDGKLAYSVAACLLLAAHQVTVFTENVGQANARILAHLSGALAYRNGEQDLHGLGVMPMPHTDFYFRFVIVATGENIEEKQALISRLENVLPQDAIIAVDMESIHLETWQQHAVAPERIIGLNWTEPAHATRFLEIISNHRSSTGVVTAVAELARTCWNKDPYVLTCGYSIRARLMAALAREAFYLVEHGYASIEDIDRACRNDPGYYLPFAGHYRYMDLMGTYAYALVMKDLNSELARSSRVPSMITDIIRSGGRGMENDKGFYSYREGEVKEWHEKFREFCGKIRAVMDKYSQLPER